jgi:hypothetical protein
MVLKEAKMSKDNTTPSNVVDITGRIQAPNYKERLRGLKVRFDLENAKIAISTSLLSIVVLVTLANNNLMSSITRDSSPDTLQSTPQARGIASVAQSMDKAADTAAENSQLVRDLANRDLSPKASLGHKPSNVERLAFGVLEGKYAVRLQHGLLKEIEISSGFVQEAKQVESLVAFIESERSLLPQFDRSLKVSSEHEDGNAVETYQLVNEVSMPVAKVQFHMDNEGRLLSMLVSPMQIASK